MQRPIKKSVLTESKWIQGRRREVCRHLQEASTSTSATAATRERLTKRALRLAKRGWSNQFDKEEALQDKKRQRGFVEAMVRNHALPEEITNDHCAVAIKENENHTMNRKRYDAAREIRQKEKPRNMVQLSAYSKVFLDCVLAFAFRAARCTPRHMSRTGCDDT